ncbi:MAG: hypothetical protein GVY32_01935 [Gammaproteobacteria bacterium]|nr:hypothetical protein [Gammaproteobacteria bacterium]
MSLWSEIKRRNVIRAGLAWLALSWLLIAIADLLFPYLGFPPEAIRGLILGLAVALVPVLVLSWMLELTPRGLRRDRGPTGDNPENVRTARRIDQLTVVLILAALGLSALREFVLVEPAEPPAEIVRVAPGEPPPAMAEPDPPVDPSSIAVLPFANMSPDSDNAYLAEGMAEELINVLSRIDGLKVASRTSSFALRDASLGVRGIGRELGVAHLVEGSVRRQDDQVRISAQLVRAADDLQLWSGSFDREVADIFALQEDIAQAITDALAGPLGVRTVEVRRATEDLRAYELYLRGRQLFAQRGASLMPARELLQRAVARDSEFAEAWALLAGVEYVLPSYFAEADTISARRAAEEAASRALARLPAEPNALAVSARLAADRGEREAALALVDRALAEDANSANTWMWKGLTLLEAGHLGAARQAFDRARRLDPLSGIHLGWLGSTELAAGEHARAADHFEQAHALGWRGPARAWQLKLALDRHGYGDRAEQAYREWIGTDGRIEPAALPVYNDVAGAFSDERQRQAAGNRISAAIERHPEHDWTPLLLNLGLTDAAIAEALRDKPPSRQIVLMMIWSPVDRAFREHPDFSRYAERAGLPAFWRTQGWPDHCRPVAAAGDAAFQLACAQ